MLGTLRFAQPTAGIQVGWAKRSVPNKIKLKTWKIKDTR